MKISILCSSKEHPVYPWLERWCVENSHQHEVELVNQSSDLHTGDILFLTSCHEIVSEETRRKFNASLVVHASDLPRGRGWSPLVWQILEGRNRITVSLLEAEDAVDSGDIWKQEVLQFEGHELYDEINTALCETVIDLMDYAATHIGDIQPVPQENGEPTYYRRRTPDDSRLDPGKSIAEQFELLRIADPVRYPAFFDYRGCRYQVRLIKVDGPEKDTG